MLQAMFLEVLESESWRILSLWSWIVVTTYVMGTTTTKAQPYGLTQRPLVGMFLNGALPAAESNPSGWQAVEAFPNLTFERPVSVAAEPGSNRILVGEQYGKIYAFTNSPSVSTKTLFLDLTPVTQGGGAGVMGFAFHPEYGMPTSTNRGYIYVFYTYSPQPAATAGYQRVSRFTVADGTNIATLASEQVLMNQYDRHQWHAGGGMFFGADSFLYVSMGDEGDNDDAFNQTQKINSGFFSGVFRIDVNKDPTKSHAIRRQPLSGATPPAGWPASYSSNYFVPNDNPWIATNGSVLEEFYALGFRSPHRMTYDSVGDRIWLGDVGQATREEVDVVTKGGNYQWAYREGILAATKPQPSPLIGTNKPPIYDYAHSDGNNCVIGGYVYRGSAFPSLVGKYIFGDNGSGRVWAMTYDGINPTTVTQLCVMPAPPDSSGLASFGLDQNNEILMSIVGDGAKIYRLASLGVQAPPPPALLSATGVFINLTNLTPDPGLLPFSVIAPLWSDNAEKFRWMAIPSNQVITFSSNGNWTFPVGTVLVKHFELPINDTNAAIRKRLETRLLVHATNATWYGLTYKWRADNTEADLLPNSLNETNLVTTATGVRTQVWYYPSRQDCRTCHTANSGQVLGPRTAQFNSDVLYPQTGTTDNQLRTLNHIGLFNTSLNEAGIPTLPRMANILDTNATLELRVHSYLQANCAHCHQPGGVQSFFDARFSTPLTNQNIVNAVPITSLGILGARLVAPQDPARSILYVRDGLVGTNQMPPLARNLVDTNYINVLASWINTLPTPPLPPPNVLGRIGNTNTSTTSDGIWDNAAYINAGRFIAASNMTVAFIHANIVGVTGRYQTAIYADNASQPATLLTASLAITNPATGWHQFLLPSSLNLASNTAYWLAIWSDSSAARVYSSTNGGTLRWGQYNFGNWPNPITTSGGSAYNYNIYATGGSAPLFNATPNDRLVAEFSMLTVTNAATDADTPFQTVGYDLANAPTGATISNNGIITWTPSEAQGPSTNQIITVANDGVVAITNSFQVIVTEDNAAPTAISESVTNAEDTSLAVVLTGNDPDGPVMNFLVETNPVNGSLSGVAPNLSYLPDTNFFGSDSFAFRVNDGSLTSAVAFVFLTITNVNDEPVAAGQAITLAEDSNAPFTLAASDPDGPALSYIILTNPIHGGLTGAPPNLVYAPNSNYFGNDALTFTVHDGSLTSACAVVTFNITNVNDAPIAQADQLTRWLSQGLVVSTTDLLTNDSDADGNLLTLQSVESPTPEGASITLSNATLRYWPSSGNTNADTFSYFVTDDVGGLATGVVSVAVMPEPPVTELLGIAGVGGQYQLGFTGVPGFTYTVQSTDNLDPASWQTLGTVTADELGNVQITDDTPGNGPTRFYRAVRGIVP